MEFPLSSQDIGVNMSIKNKSHGISHSSGEALFSCKQVFSCENPTEEQKDKFVRNIGTSSGRSPWIFLTMMIIAALGAIVSHN